MRILLSVSLSLPFLFCGSSSPSDAADLCIVHLLVVGRSIAKEAVLRLAVVISMPMALLALGVLEFGGFYYEFFVLLRVHGASADPVDHLYLSSIADGHLVLLYFFLLILLLITRLALVRRHAI